MVESKILNNKDVEKGGGEGERTAPNSLPVEHLHVVLYTVY